LIRKAIQASAVALGANSTNRYRCRTFPRKLTKLSLAHVEAVAATRAYRRSIDVSDDRVECAPITLRH
jgi:hypothetical protein